MIDRNQTVQVAVTSADRAASFEELVPWLLAPLGLLVVLLGLLIHTAVEELLRFESPLQLNNRQLDAPLTLGDHTLPAGDFQSFTGYTYNESKTWQNLGRFQITNGSLFTLPGGDAGFAVVAEAGSEAGDPARGGAQA